jgi:ribosomal-protein-alanine N-acetyltransferase
MIRLAPLTLAHMPVAAVLHAEAFGPEAWSEQALAEILAMPGAFGTLASENREGEEVPLGFGLYLLAGDSAEILSLAVAREARRRGIGSRLIDAFVADASKAGAREAFLEVAEDNPAAIGLYSRFDFSKVGLRPDYYQRPDSIRISAYLLRRALP